MGKVGGRKKTGEWWCSFLGGERKGTGERSQRWFKALVTKVKEGAPLVSTVIRKNRS